MFAKTLASGAQLRPLEPWMAEEFAAHLDRAREHIRPWVGPSFVTEDVAGARATLGRYAERAAREGAGIYGIWADGTLVGGVMFVDFVPATGVFEVGCWLEPAAEGRGTSRAPCATCWSTRSSPAACTAPSGAAAATTTAARPSPAASG